MRISFIFIVSRVLNVEAANGTFVVFLNGARLLLSDCLRGGSNLSAVIFPLSVSLETIFIEELT